MLPLLLYTFTFGPLETSVLVLTIVVIIYSVAKGVMRYLENKKDKKD